MTQRVDAVLDRIDTDHGIDLYVMEGDHPVILRLRDKGIKTFDASWLFFTRLRELDLANNKLQIIPADIHKLRVLDRLDLTRNRIAKVPVGFMRLTNLRGLYLGSNRLTVLPEKIGDLRILSSLDLGGNRLTELPKSLGQLKYLRELLVGQNNLTSIPHEIGYLTRLDTLDLTRNQLTTLPASLGSLTNLRTLGLGGNPLTEPLATLAKRGREAVLSYLRSISEHIPLYEAKILLVGEGNVGKSSLVDALLGKIFQENRDPTHGINVGSLPLPNPIDPPQNLMLNTWDFGGQDLYRITHQFFYSKRSIYLLVWKPREGVEQNFVEAWLQRLKLRLGKKEAKVLVVSTHCDDVRADIDKPGLREKFGEMVVDFFEIDSKTGTGIQELKDAIATIASRLPQMGNLMNPNWVKARDEVCSLPDMHINRKEFGNICKKHGMDHTATLTLADLLHDLGKIIHYSEHDGLQDLVVLKPEWLTRAISLVLVDKETIAAKGVLDHQRLRSIWSNPSGPTEFRYSSKLHPYFLRLMEEFFISYRDDSSSQSIVSQMVPFERPPLPPHESGAKLTLNYRLESEAPGLVPWLIVRTHRFSTGLHWRRGMFLRHQSHSATIELDSSDRLLSVNVYGQAPSYLFHLLIDIVDQVMARWPGLDYETLIPCRTPVCTESSKPGYFDLRVLERARAVPRPTYPCSRCMQDVDINELLTGFGAGPKSSILNDILVGIKATATNVQRLDTRLSEFFGIVRRVWKGFSSELFDGPGLFTLWPDEEYSLWEQILLKGLTEEKYELRLWCSHAECPHPVARHTVKQTKEWLRTAAPYINLSVKILQLAIPVVGAGIAEIIPEDYSKIKPKIDVMDKFAGSLKDEFGLSDSGNLRDSGLTEAHGAGLRAFQSLLHKIDPDRSWGNLRRVSNPAGDILWVCPKHYPLYDQGLPELPSDM